MINTNIIISVIGVIAVLLFLAEVFGISKKKKTKVNMGRMSVDEIIRMRKEIERKIRGLFLRKLYLLCKYSIVDEVGGIQVMRELNDIDKIQAGIRNKTDNAANILTYILTELSEFDINFIAKYLAPSVKINGVETRISKKEVKPVIEYLAIKVETHVEEMLLHYIKIYSENTVNRKNLFLLSLRIMMAKHTEDAIFTENIIDNLAIEEKKK